jgi:hypothetical protein
MPLFGTKKRYDTFKILGVKKSREIKVKIDIFGIGNFFSLSFAIFFYFIFFEN